MQRQALVVEQVYTNSTIIIHCMYLHCILYLYYCTNLFIKSLGQIWLDNLNCDASDEVLEDCTHNGWGVHNCRHYSDVGVICRKSKYRHADTGLI